MRFGVRYVIDYPGAVVCRLRPDTPAQTPAFYQKAPANAPLFLFPVFPKGSSIIAPVTPNSEIAFKFVNGNIANFRWKLPAQLPEGGCNGLKRVSKTVIHWHLLLIVELFAIRRLRGQNKGVVPGRSRRRFLGYFGTLV